MDPSIAGHYLPVQDTFTCSSCKAASSPNTVRNNGGRCWNCGADLSPSTGGEEQATPETTNTMGKTIDCCPDQPVREGRFTNIPPLQTVG